jgi:hypothetical protein
MGEYYPFLWVLEEESEDLVMRYTYWHNHDPSYCASEVSL